MQAGRVTACGRGCKKMVNCKLVCELAMHLLNIIARQSGIGRFMWMDVQIVRGNLNVPGANGEQRACGA